MLLVEARPWLFNVAIKSADCLQQGLKSQPQHRKEKPSLSSDALRTLALLFQMCRYRQLSYIKLTSK